MPDLIPKTPAEAQAKEAKQPSRFFLEYYGPAFLFLIAAFVILALMLLKPIIDDIKTTNAEAQAELKIADSEQIYLNSLDASIAAAQNISPEVLQRVTQALPTESNVPAFLVQFGSAAYANGIKIDSLAFSDSKNAPKPASGKVETGVTPLDITLTIHARSYFDVKRFLSALETSLRVVDVIGMATGGGAGEAYYTLQLRSYVFTQTTTIP